MGEDSDAVSCCVHGLIFVCDAVAIFRFFAFCFFAFCCAGIRDLLALFRRCPCAGRHLLFFAAAKKSRQKKAAHPASPCSYPRAPSVPLVHPASLYLAAVASALSGRLTCSVLPYISKPQQTIAAALRQTVCRLSHHMRRGTECFLAGTLRFTA